MKIVVIAIGRRMPGWVQEGVDEYAKRLPQRWQFSVREFAQAPGSTGRERSRREADTLIGAIPDRAHVVALDGGGSSWTTEKVAAQLAHWQSLGKPLCLLIGGPDGLDPTCLARADQRWSLSALTFPHPLVRIVVTEQLYRAHSLASNHPYHRA